MVMTLKEEYGEVIDSQIAAINDEFMDVDDVTLIRSLIGETLKNRLMDVVTLNEGVGAWPLIRETYAVVQSETVDELVEALVRYHKQELESMRQARYRKGVDVEQEALIGLVWDDLTQYVIENNWRAE